MTSRAWVLLAATLGACGGGGGGGDDAPPPCDPDAPNTICTIAGNGDQGFDGDGGPATAATLYVPQDMAIAPDGNLWIDDFNNYMIRAILPDGTIHVVVGIGEVGDSPVPGTTMTPALQASFNHTSDLFFFNGYLYLASWHNSRIKRVNIATMEVENFAGLGRRTYYDGDEGPALDASLDLPSSVAHDTAGNIVIMDQANQVVRSVDTLGNIHRIVGTCVVELDSPCAVGVLPQPCPNSDKLACGDLATECAKPCTPSYGGDNGPALEARLAQPFGQAADPAGRLTYDNQGNLFLADSENNRIRKVDTAGTITTYAGTGTAGYSGDGGPASAAQISRPIDIEVGDDGTLYFTDVGNSCVRKIDPAGIISTVAGHCDPDPAISHGFAGDGGPPTEALLDRPYGVHIAGNKLYIADSYNNRIRVVNLP